jgi:hypothetical protein
MNPNLIMIVDKMAGFSTNTFKLETQNKSTAKSSDIVSFSMPANSIVNLRSLAVYCNATTTLSGSAVVGARLPPVDDLIERVEVSVGGIVLSQGSNFSNVLLEFQKVMGTVVCDSVLSHPEYVRSKSYVDPTKTFTGTANEEYDDGILTRFCITKFPGFLSTADPKFMDLGLMPDMTIRLYLASDNVLTTSNGTGMGEGAAAAPFEAGFASTSVLTGAKYQLSNIFATIECMSLNDRSYDEMIQNQIARNEYVEIPYKSYQSFQETHSGASRFTISTQSLDRVWVGWRDATFNTQGNPIIVDGYKTAGGKVNTTGALAIADLDLGLCGYDSGGQFDNDKEKYRSKYFNFAAPSEDMTMQMSINSTFHPMFPANMAVMYGMTRNSLQNHEYTKDMTLPQYLKNYCVQCFRLNLPESEQLHQLTGLDCRSSNLAGLITTNGAGANNLNINIFTESTSILRVGAGRAVDIVA